MHRWRTSFVLYRNSVRPKRVLVYVAVRDSVCAFRTRSWRWMKLMLRVGRICSTRASASGRPPVIIGSDGAQRRQVHEDDANVRSNWLVAADLITEKLVICDANLRGLVIVQERQESVAATARHLRHRVQK